MNVSRRRFVVNLTATACVADVFSMAQSTGGPIVWSVRRNRSKVYLFGFSDVRDSSWLSSTVKRAFLESDELWFETSLPYRTPAPSESELRQKLGHDSKRGLFQVLGPSLSERTLKVADELNLTKSDLESLRPWFAFTVINSAFRVKYKLVASGETPDVTLAKMGNADHKTLDAEFATSADLTRFYDGLSDEAQREHIEDLLDFIDDQKAGRNQDDYGWANGQLDPRFIERMRKDRPALYDAMHVQRNRAWAKRIAEFLDSDRTYFICMGLNHVLGPDSIPVYLERQKIVLDKA